jgi:hypothetical protein
LESTHEAEPRRRGHDTVPARERGAGEEASGTGSTSELVQRAARARHHRRDYDEPDTSQRSSLVLIDISTPEGKASGLDQDSLVSALFLATVFEDRIDRVVGRLSDALMQKVDASLKATMALS